MDHDALAAACKALGHPARLQIVELLARQEECRGADVFGELPLAQSTVSQHLGVLKDAGVVRSKPVGTSMVYCLEPQVLDEVVDQMTRIAAEANRCASRTRGECS